MICRRTLITFLAFVLAPFAWPDLHKEAAFRLGGLRLGETLDNFRGRFPGAACGTIKRYPINRHTLDDPDGSGYLTCCVDVPNSLTKFSEFQVVAVEEQCPVLIGFWREKLVNVGFTVEASSIEKVLPNFEKSYGPAHQKIYGRSILQRDKPDGMHREGTPLSLASWWYGNAKLELSIAVLDPTNGHGLERRLVQIDMWT